MPRRRNTLHLATTIMSLLPAVQRALRHPRAWFIGAVAGRREHVQPMERGPLPRAPPEMKQAPGRRRVDKWCGAGLRRKSTRLCARRRRSGLPTPRCSLRAYRANIVDIRNMVDTRNMVDSRQSLFGRIAQGRAVQTRVRVLKEFGLTRPASVCVQVQQLEEANKRLMHVNLALTSLVARRARHAAPRRPRTHSRGREDATWGRRRHRSWGNRCVQCYIFIIMQDNRCACNAA